MWRLVLALLLVVCCTGPRVVQTKVPYLEMGHGEEGGLPVPYDRPWCASNRQQRAYCFWVESAPFHYWSHTSRKRTLLGRSAVDPLSEWMGGQCQLLAPPVPLRARHQKGCRVMSFERTQWCGARCWSLEAVSVRFGCGEAICRSSPFIEDLGKTAALLQLRSSPGLAGQCRKARPRVSKKRF